ncbi:phosphonoacetaldehyde phosphonohydrolase-related protein [Pseudomonas vranovensis]|uniref:Phosphonoacetaldehyde phosphonohydrolase-related protein n=1 Tax=Pseudomonas vranovensis TaxID=321661 RepID=A0A423DTN6_9PSED|nr:phosphonoacetaldehyde phosphonohydrolase-related protein [Pseudomonas vranovensis]ROL75369.1 phosphonoacetaldehyde phosphonohydrolase-related protein [Pseudomonas vranovensis]
MPDSPAITALLFGLRGCLVEVHPGPGAQAPCPTPGALPTLDWLYQQKVPCAWLDELSTADGKQMASPLPAWLNAFPACKTPWPAPDACWQALMSLRAGKLDGCVLVSGEPRLLQSGLNAGLWTIGLAACGPSSQWQALGAKEQERQRGQATLQLFALGVHSVIDHLEALADCLADIGQRRRKGEKP